MVRQRVQVGGGPDVAAERKTALQTIQERTLQVLRKEIGPVDSIALVDFPWYQNAGDSLIYLGELAYLQQLGIRVSYVCDIPRYDAGRLRRAHPDGPIVLRGGGNFGDRYPQFQAFREQVAADFPDRPVIQLPQSIEFLDRDHARQSHDRLREHPDFTLMVRENPSLRLAGELFPDVRAVYCPDSAFGVGLQQPRRRQAPEADVVWLRRTDSESVPRDIDLGVHSVCTVDWGLQGIAARLWRLSGKPERARMKYPALDPLVRLPARLGYRAMAEINVHEAVRTLSRGRVLLTDRLHAAVLGALMGMPVVALDNNYGKVSSIHADYLHLMPDMHFARTEEEASAMVADLVSR